MLRLDSISGLFDPEDEYESLPQNAGWQIHMIAGSLAGIGEHSVMYPIDVVKTRMQALLPASHARYSSVLGGLWRIAKHEGIRGNWRGVSAITGGAAPAHALYFSVYEKAKSSWNRGIIKDTVFVNAIAGCFATVFHDSVMIPAEVVKQRMQMCDSPYRSCRDCGKCVYQGEGFRAFYRAFGTQCFMNVPFHVTNFVVYESMQNWLNPDRKYCAQTHSISGAAAGACAAAITTPLDVCKTLLNTQERFVVAQNGSGGVLTGMWSAIATIYRIKGLRGFAQGLRARVLFQMPATCISWSIYEFFKNFLKDK